MPARTQNKQHPTHWQKGQSGNPKGRPAGSRNKASLAVDALLDGEAEKLTRVCIERALGGDSVALRLAMERICPPRQGRPLPEGALDVPESATPAAMSAAVVEATLAGAITTDEAKAMAGLVDAHRKVLEATDLEQRLAAIEAKLQELTK